LTDTDKQNSTNINDLEGHLPIEILQLT